MTLVMLSKHDATFFPFLEVFRTCKTLLVGGLSIKILVKAAFYGESMKIGGEGYLDLLN